MMHGIADVTGIDLEQEAIDHANHYFPGPTYQLGDVRDSRGEFDWVVSLETLEHLPDPERALASFRSSKRLICSTPNQKHYPFNPESYRNDRFPHIRHYKPEGFDALLQSCGWKVIERHCQETKRSPVTPGVEGMFLIYVCE